MHLTEHAVHGSYHSIFSLQASHHFNRRMRGVLADMARDMAYVFGDNLLSLVVGGAYGKGSGRICRVSRKAGTGVWSGGEAPADDLVLLVILNAPAFDQDEFSKVCCKYQDILGIHLDILGVLTPSQIRRLKPTIHWHELSRCHKILWGDSELVDNILSCLDLGRNAFFHANSFVVPEMGPVSDVDGLITKGTGCESVRSVSLANSRTLLVQEAYRLAGESVCHALSTLVMMKKRDLLWDDGFYQGRYEKTSFRIGAAVLLAGGCIPGGEAEDHAAFAAIAAELRAGQQEAFKGLCGAYFESRFALLRRENDRCEFSAVAAQWRRLFASLVWAMNYIEGIGFHLAGSSGEIGSWASRRDWSELRTMVEEADRRGLDLEHEQIEWISRVLSRIAGNFIPL